MLAAGTAFKCYVTQEELQARRDEGEAKRAAAKAEGLAEDERRVMLAEADALLAPFRSPFRDGGDPPSPDAPFTVRLRAPDDGDITISDHVQGEVSIKTREIDDLILLRADGTPTYMLAVVVDDHDMGVTHIIRGDDHFRNAFRQLPIYMAMGWDVPEFAHVPLIHGDDGKKLSKRHGALSTLAYRDMGYLPETMRAYLLRLGWSQGDKEIFTDTEAAAAFDLSGLNKSPARLDFGKLNDVNGHFLRAADPELLLELLKPLLDVETPLTDSQLAAVRQALPDMACRASTLPELAQSFAFMTTPRPLQLNKKARKALRGEGLDRVAAMRDLIADITDFNPAALQSAIDSYCAAQDLGMGQVGPPLRAALTGGLPAPDLAPVMSWLGREEVLGRLDDQIAASRETE